MKVDNLNKWITVAANLGVIIGIIFLVVEINQNNELLAAQDRYNRLQVSNYGPNLFLEDADLTKIFYETPPSERTESENILVNFYWSNVLRGLEWTFIELPKNELPTEKWKRSIDREIILDRWSSISATYDPDFVEYLENFVLEIGP